MNPIVKTDRKLPSSIKLIVFLFFLIFLISFFLHVKYAEKNEQLPQLKFDAAILAPTSSAAGGFYTNPFSISLISQAGENTIYYTLDGSEPTVQSLIYKMPIIIYDRTGDLNRLSNVPTSPRWKPPVGVLFKGTVLRAIAVAGGDKKSKEFVRTFFVTEKGNKKYSIPVIAITVNPDDFFGYRKGIYVLGKRYEDKDNYIHKNISLDQPWWSYPSNYLMRGERSERPVHIEFYRTDGSLGFEEDAGARINGNKTRGLSQKSLRITFDEKYGSKNLNYKLFPEYNLNKFNSFILRNAGNDWNKTMFRDAFMQYLMKETNIEIQRYCPSIVFINGEYWGIHNIRERLDEDFIANKYNISKDSIAILESGAVFYGANQDSVDFQQLLSYVKSNDLSLTVNYQHVKKLIDLENFVDFIIANVYFCNGDWQEKFWRYKLTTRGNDSSGIRDGRWRWMLYDTDWGFGYTGTDAIQLNLLEVIKGGGNIGVIFDGLLKNEGFLARFNTRFQYHLDHTFKMERVITVIDSFAATLKPEMEDHINRWREIGSYKNWELFVQQLKFFAVNRHAVQTKQLKEFIEKNKKIK